MRRNGIVAHAANRPGHFEKQHTGREMKTRNRTQSILAAFVAMAICAWGAGCATTEMARPGPDREPLPDSIPAEMTKAVLTVGVAAQAVDADAEPVAAELRNRLRSTLAEDGYAVADGAGDLLLALKVRAQPFDQTGSYFVYEGEAAARVASVDLNRTLGEKQFDARAKRELGRAAAQKALALELAGQIGPWVQESLQRGSSGLVAEDLVVKMRWLATNQAGYAEQLLETVKALDGVVNARLVNLNRREREIAVRAVYYTAKLPDGLLYTLALRHPELKLRLP